MITFLSLNNNQHLINYVVKIFDKTLQGISKYPDSKKVWN